MTPLEIAEHKNGWKHKAIGQFIDPDADIWAKDWCRRNLERHRWSFSRYARPDDWHHITFERVQDAIDFSNAYDERHNKC